MMKQLERVIALAAVVVIMPFISHAQQQQGTWAQNHPRRVQVNRRLNNQNNRVKNGVKSGKLNQRQANRIHRQDRRIRNQERRMAARDGGHLTKADQQKLNHEENGVSREINRDESRNTQQPGTGGTSAPSAPTTPAAGN